LQYLHWQRAMSGTHRLAQHVLESGTGTNEGIMRNPDALGDLVSRLETDAVDFVREQIRVCANALDRIFAIGFVDAHCPAGADSVRVEKDHDLANDLLVGPCGL